MFPGISSLHYYCLAHTVPLKIRFIASSWCCYIPVVLRMLIFSREGFRDTESQLIRKITPPPRREVRFRCQTLRDRDYLFNEIKTTILLLSPKESNEEITTCFCGRSRKKKLLEFAATKHNLWNLLHFFTLTSN